LFNFDILRVRNDYYKKVNDNNNSSISPCQKDEKENEGKIIKSNENSIIINKKERQDSSHNIQNKIPIDFIKNNINDDYKDNLDSIENTEKSMSINPKKPTYYIPFKKIFKENIKKIDIDELKYNDCGKNHKENAKIIIPFEKIRKRTEENKMFPHENLNSNKIYANPGNKNEYFSHNIFNLQNNSNNILDYIKIIEEEKKFN
jgi:hypothetical protein